MYDLNVGILVFAGIGVAEILVWLFDLENRNLRGLLCVFATDSDVKTKLITCKITLS